MSDIASKNLQFLSVGDFEIRRWENKIGLLEISFWAIVYKKNFLVFGKEFAISLGFTNSKKAIIDHVDPEDITTIESVFGRDFKLTLKRHFQGGNDSLAPLFFQNLQPHQKLISKLGIYALCLGSKLEGIKPFRRWVYGIIDEVMETGSYSLPNVQQLSLEETPKEKIESTYKYIPNFKFDGDNTERKELSNAFKKGKELSKNLKQSEKGSLGGIERDKRDKNRAKLLVKICNSKEDLKNENLKKELEEIVTTQK